MTKENTIFTEGFIDQIEEDYIALVSNYGHINDYILTRLELADPHYDEELGLACANMLAEDLSYKLAECGK